MIGWSATRSGRALRPGRLGPRRSRSSGNRSAGSRAGGRAGRAPTPSMGRPGASTTSPNSARPPSRTPLPPASLPGRALIEAGEYRVPSAPGARVDLGPARGLPSLGVDADLASGHLALEPRLPAVVEGGDRPADAGSHRGIRPDRLLPALLRGGGAPVGRRARRLADAGGRLDHGEPLPGREPRRLAGARAADPKAGPTPAPGALV